MVSEDSQCDNVGVGCFHGDGQRVLSSLINSVLIGSSLQQQAHLPMAANQKHQSQVSEWVYALCVLVLCTLWGQNKNPKSLIADVLLLVNMQYPVCPAVAAACSAP